MSATSMATAKRMLRRVSPDSDRPPSFSGSEVVFFGNGDGTLQSTPKTSAGVINSEYAAVGDFNGDGKLDLLVTANELFDQPNAWLVLGNGDGTFQAPVVALPNVGGQVIAADVNGDGKLDLIMEQPLPPVGQIYLGAGDGSFTNSNNYILNYDLNKSLVATGDFNNDGKLDVAMGNAVLLGKGDGTFAGTPVVPTPEPLGPVVAGVFDKNVPEPGVAAVASNLYIFHNDGKGNLALAHQYAAPSYGQAMGTADFDGDGNLDLFIASLGGTTDKWNYTVFLGNGDESFKAPVFV